MKRSLLAFAFAIASCSAPAQTYSPMQWGMNVASSPYPFGALIGGTWRNFGTVTSAGVWSLSDAVLNQAPTIASLSSSYIGSDVTSITVNGYYAAGDGGGGLYIKIPTPAPAKAWMHQSADGAWWSLRENVVIPRQFGAKADNATDDATAFAGWISYCETMAVRCHIPEYGSLKYYVLGAKITNTVPIDISSDASAVLRFTNVADNGFVIDYRAAGISGTGGVNNISLPRLYSPAMDYILAYPGYPASWTGGARTGTGVTLWGGSRYNVSVQYMAGWADGVLVQGTYDLSNGGRSPKNVNININTIDLNINGVTFDVGPSGAEQVTAVFVTANTIFAKYPVRLITGTGSSFPLTHLGIEVLEAFTNEADGACVYQTAKLAHVNDIEFHGCYAGYSPLDSPAGTSTSLTLPYVAGDQASNGSTTDGNSSLGYFGGAYNVITVGNSDPKLSLPGTYGPGVGRVTRIRDVGQQNSISVKYLSYPPLVPVTLTTTAGEVNYNGGVGGAAYAKRIYGQATVSTLAAGASEVFYFYHTMFSADTVKSVTVVPMSSFGNPSFITAGLSVTAQDNAVAVNREGLLTFKNNTGGSIAGATYLFWIDVGE